MANSFKNDVQCKSCGKMLQPKDAVCPQCGTEVPSEQREKIKKHQQGGKIGCGVLALIAVGALAYFSFSDKKAVTQPAEKSSEQAAVKSKEQALPTPTPPEPRYSSIDGDEYLYTAGISDKDQEAGQVANSILAFRYKGIKDGKIVLTAEGATLTCEIDCKIITTTNAFGGKERVQYNPDSVAGSAFSDAMNGFLVEHPSASKRAAGK